MTRVTHDAVVLDALRRGPQTASQLYSLGLIAHSRVASLRKRGHVIRCERIHGVEGARGYVYTLAFDAEAPVAEEQLSLA